MMIDTKLVSWNKRTHNINKEKYSLCNRVGLGYYEGSKESNVAYRLKLEGTGICRKARSFLYWRIAAHKRKLELEEKKKTLLKIRKTQMKFMEDILKK